MKHLAKNDDLQTSGKFTGIDIDAYKCKKGIK